MYLLFFLSSTYNYPVHISPLFHCPFLITYLPYPSLAACSEGVEDGGEFDLRAAMSRLHELRGHKIRLDHAASVVEYALGQALYLDTRELELAIQRGRTELAAGTEGSTLMGVLSKAETHLERLHGLARLERHLEDQMQGLGVEGLDDFEILIGQARAQGIPTERAQSHLMAFREWKARCDTAASQLQSIMKNVHHRSIPELETAIYDARNAGGLIINLALSKCPVKTINLVNTSY